MGIFKQGKALFCVITFLGSSAWAAELLTNATHWANAPSWITKGKVDKVVEHMQSQLEWDIRRCEVQVFTDSASFSAAHGLGPSAIAVTLKNKNIILLGPEVTAENFDSVFGHEIVHVISFQKYKTAIPAWLEEGLANQLSHAGKVDYKWLKTQPPLQDVRSLTHPMNGGSALVHYHYQASQALAEMISAKCDFRNLLRLSVGVGMEGYLDTYCGIKDVNSAFQKWVTTR
jgi:hypothetical protein